MASTSFQWIDSTSPNIPALVTQGLAYASSNVTGTTNIAYGGRTWIYSSSFTAAECSSAHFGARARDLGFRRGDNLVIYDNASSGPIVKMAKINPTSSGFVVFTTGSAALA